MSYFIHFNQCFSFQFCGLQFFSISFTKVVKFAKSFQKKKPFDTTKTNYWFQNWCSCRIEDDGIYKSAKWKLYPWKRHENANNGNACILFPIHTKRYHTYNSSSTQNLFSKALVTKRECCIDIDQNCSELNSQLIKKYLLSQL